MPILPAPSPYAFDLDEVRAGEDLVAVGADLEPGTVLEAYSAGLFPMGVGKHGSQPIGWWLYGLALGGLFAGESMFHRVTDASKAALVGLHGLLAADGDPRRLLDVQWRTGHLATLGISEVPRKEYLRLLAQALTAPLPEPFR